jgi:hypothetical protein
MNDEEPEIDERLRVWARAQRSSAPDVAVRVERLAESHGRMMPMLAAAAAVLAVAGGITAVKLTDRESASHHSDATTPAGDQQIVFHGLAIDVPQSWPLNAMRCGQPIRDTVVLPGPVDLCGSTGPPPAFTSVQFGEGGLDGPPGTLTEHAGETSVAGETATRASGWSSTLYVIAVTVPALSASVTISSPAQATAEALAATLTVVDRDSNGCQAHASNVSALPTGESPIRPGAQESLIPGTPMGLTVCRYVRGLVEQSSSLDAQARESLLDVVNSLPEGLSRADPKDYLPELCSGSPSSSTLNGHLMDSEAYVIRADYASGPSVTVVVRLGLCGDLGASNGTRTGQRQDSLLEPLLRAAGETVGIPGKVLPVK